MLKIGIDEHLHALICEYVDGRLTGKKKKLLEEVAAKRKSVRDMIDDSMIARDMILRHQDELKRNFPQVKTP
ncbi:hypothetical protein EP331_07615 [bacterium]|nr:MAG: hypothetical protein EP331_07615 [bacterium]